MITPRSGSRYAGIPVLLCLLAALFLGILPAGADNPSEMALAPLQNGDNLASQEMYMEAIDAYNEAIAIDPYNSIIWNRLGIAEMKVGRFRDAANAFQEAINLDPFYSAAWNNKGDALYALEEYEAAIDSYNRALAINSNDHYALLQKGISLQEMGRPGEAMGVYLDVISLAEREVRKHPNDAQYDAVLWTNKGEALLRLGRYSEALEAYKIALQINPKYERALTGIELTNDTILRARGTLEQPVIPIVTQTAEPDRDVPVPLTGATVVLAILIAAFIVFCSLSRQDSDT